MSKDVLNHQQRRARRPISNQTLKRIQQRVIGGVGGGVAKFIGANPLSVRLLLVVGLCLSLGVLGLVYVLLWLLLPQE